MREGWEVRRGEGGEGGGGEDVVRVDSQLEGFIEVRVMCRLCCASEELLLV